MKTRNKEREILLKAIERLEQATDLIAEVHPENDPQGPDAVIRIKWQNMEWYFAVEIKYAFTPAVIGGTVQRMRKFHEKGLLVTRYITPQVAETLKELDIPFIDTTGNAYINEPPLLIFIKGNRPDDRFNKRPPTRAFRPTGLQLIYAFLCNPGLENAPYREIAKLGDVALGTVGWVMHDLKMMGHLVDMGKRGRRLIQKEKLLRRWVTEYPEQLRPKNIIGRYQATNPDWWRHAEPPTPEVYWGGEVAAAILTEYLKPEIITIYTHRRLALHKWLTKNRIRKDPDGKIEVLKAFWTFENVGLHTNLVHPMLIYADLLATGDTRNIETAEMIYEQELTQFIRED